jgi:hypothetical protein
MMTTQQLITSDMKKARPFIAVCRAMYDNANLDAECAQRLNEAPKFADALLDLIKKFSSNKHPAASDIEKFFVEVFGLKYELDYVPFPQVAGAPCYMLSAECVPFSTQQMWDKVITWAKPKDKYVWSNLSTEMQTPQPLKVFAHRGGDEPDSEHLNKSYDQSKAEKLDIVDVRDYILITAFHMWKHKKWMDAIGWTRLDSLWSDGGIVSGDFDSQSGRLCLDDDYRVNRHPNAGPRERFWVNKT